MIDFQTNASLTYILPVDIVSKDQLFHRKLISH